MNLSTSGMMANFRQDIVSRQLSVSANSGASIYYPTSSAIKSNHETDKQAEENATWFFEYKALLNSKLTTLTTALTSAYTTDLDASMTKVDRNLWGERNAMQGITGTLQDLYAPFGVPETPVIDPGAARTANAYFQAFGFYNIQGNQTDDDMYGTKNATFDPVAPADTLSFTLTMQSNAGNVTNFTTGALIGNSQNAYQTITPIAPISARSLQATVNGTTTFVSGGSSTSSPLVLDNLYVDLADSKNNNYTNIKNASQRVSPYPTSIEPNKNIGNNLELTLYKFFSKPENYDLIRFGLMDELYIVGTSSLATGSQIQGSISLRYKTTRFSANDLNGDGDILDPGESTPETNNLFKSFIEIKQERFSCFFHS